LVIANWATFRIPPGCMLSTYQFLTIVSTSITKKTIEVGKVNAA